MKLCIAHGGDLSQPSGGTDRVMAIAEGLKQTNIDIVLVTPTPDDTLQSKLRDVDVRTVDTALAGVSHPLIRGATVVRAAQRVATKEQRILQFEHSTLAGIGTLFGAENYVLDMHDLAHPRYEHIRSPVSPLLEKFVAWLEKQAVQQAKSVITVSNEMRELIKSRLHVSREGIHVVPNGYFPETIKIAADSEVIQGRVSFLGTLHPKVDIETFVEISEHPTVSEMVVIGSGAQLDRLQKLASDYSDLRVTGRLPNKEAFHLLGGSQAVINPQSSSELQRSSSPVKLFYYAALGRPMIVSEGPELGQKLKREDAAVTVGSDDNFTECVIEVLENPSTAQRIAENAESLSEQFSWSRRVSELLSVYSQDLHCSGTKINEKSHNDKTE